LARTRRKSEDAGETSADGSRRLCAATRAELEPGELIRFIADPAGEIIPDLGRRLPGRGVWLKADKAVVVDAIRGKVFAKSLKRPVTAAPDLADKVEALMERRAQDALSLANKAGLVTTGFAQVDALVESGDAAALVHGRDGAEGGQEKLNKKLFAISKARGREATLVTCLSTEQLSLAMGRSNVVHAALIHGGATERFLSEAGRLTRYRSGSAAS
jgi:predicted RNA-binding protein YlxR (DUF448 family)